MSNSTNNNPETLSKEELIKRYKSLEGERNKRLKADMAVANVNKLLENENARIKSIQDFIGEALKLNNITEIYELTIETIIEAFECENALFLTKTTDNRYKVIYDFSATFTTEYLELNTSIHDTKILADNDRLFINSELLNCANVMISSINSHDNHNVIIAYNSINKIGTFEKLTKEHINSFQIIANQIGTILENIKTRNEIEDLSKHLEQKVDERTKELNEQKEFVQIVLDSQEQIIITTNGETITSANKTFLEFFGVDDIESFKTLYRANCICESFNTKAPQGYLQIEMDNEKWIDYVIARSSQNITHKAMITRRETDFIFSVTAAKLPGDEGLKSAVFTNITEMEKTKQEVEEIHKHTRESIEYASLIQGALIPDADMFKNFFQDYFAIWHPKDIVGGDIYLMNELNENEVVIMVIDCTGHGVPGAFVTMLVKAIERQLMANIHKDETISPAKILSVFNKSIKNLLKQETIDSVSNAGFDGGIIYYNKKEKIIKFSGAETALFYIDENDELKTIKGSRHSVGYKKSDINFEFKEHTINVKEGMKFYCSTDGYLDQNGGEKGFPFGKKKLQNIIKEHHTKLMTVQEEIFLNTLNEYQEDEERNDDITFLGFRI